MFDRVNVEPDRQRGDSRRSEILRERIADYIMASGGRAGEDRARAIREDFVDAAVRIADRRGMRTWKGADDSARRYSASSSLEVLFGEKVNTVGGKGGKGGHRRTGVNSRWVLDIWEATLDHLTREDPFSRPVQEPEETPDDVNVEPDADDGVRIYQSARTGSLSASILDAYLSRDDEAIMRIAIDVEGLERARRGRAS